MKDQYENHSDKELYIEILKELIRIREKMPDGNKPKAIDLGYITNSDLLILLKISAGTAANWRKLGLLRYAKIEGCIFYKISDIQDMMQQHFQRS